MTPFKKLAVAGAIAAFGVAANASTLAMEFGGTTVFNFDATHSDSYKADLQAIVASEAKYSTFEGWIVIGNYENYLTGSHTLSFGNYASDVSFSLFSGLVNGVEGANSSPSKPNPNYVPGVANCTARGGCDTDGDGAIDTPRNNNPEFVNGGYSTLPSGTTWGDGTVTLVNGRITGVHYESVATAGSLVAYQGAGWAPSSTNAADTINNAVLGRGGWNTRIQEIDVLVNNTSAARLVAGDATLGTGVYIANGLGGVATVDMTMAAAVPEPGTYAMMAAGLGAIGFVARRRRRED